MHNYHDTYGTFCPGSRFVQAEHDASCHSRGSWYCGMMGWPVYILPFMEGETITNSMNLNVIAYTNNGGEHSWHDGNSHGDSANQLAANSMPSVFACPSCPKPFDDSKNNKDYAVNGGRGCAERMSKTEGVFHKNSSNGMRDITDGTSNTFLFLEAAHYWKGRDGKWIDQPANPFFWVNHATAGYAVYREACAFPPNSVNCRETRTARSHHPGGLNVTMGDGSTHFLSETVNFDLYSYTFTKQGGEATGAFSN